MTLDLIAFIAAILFGILLYWKESKGNGLYRFFNKLFNSKELQMKADNPKGFVYQQSLLLRIVFITVLFLIGIIVVQFLIPFNFTIASLFASGIVGAIVGTYLAHFIIKSGDVIEDKSESLTEMVSDTIERGKDFIEDITHKDETTETVKEEPKTEPKKEEKSARERLKDKGYM